MGPRLTRVRRTKTVVHIPHEEEEIGKGRRRWLEEEESYGRYGKEGKERERSN